ncbi:hypothetical protein [Aridibaculum aurantiacum]|uniref:hypothetical protein n=1 Tax=Aridibaculum aurantiacum TaxID=2810307 RepID=UPI001A96C58D|nr:hypothetical protein [Aridibaculum aurantiacum]
MKIEFNKNIQFTKLVKAEGRLREFNFRKINSIKEGQFTVDVCDDRGNRKIFNMRKGDQGWKIALEENLPEWIITNEAILNELIEEELKNN